jgi:hypothetical protein
MTKTVEQELLEIRGSLPAIPKNGYNNHTKSHHHKLEDILRVLTPILLERGLMLTETVGTENGEQVVSQGVARIESPGDSFEPIGTMFVPKMNEGNAHKVGGGITYSRRYILVTYFGISDDDDDGNSVTAGAGAQPTTQPATRPGEDPAIGLRRQLHTEIVERLTASGHQATREEVLAVSEAIGLVPGQDHGPQQINAAINCLTRDWAAISVRMKGQQQ